MTPLKLKRDGTTLLVMLGLAMTWPAWAKSPPKQAPLLCQQGHRLVPCPDATVAEKPKGHRADSHQSAQDRQDFKAQPTH